MNWHPYAERFGILDGAEYESFLASIRETGGNEQPISYRVLPDGTRQGLDGRNRWKACQELGIEPYLEEVIVSDDRVKGFILRRNLHRRHMTAEQRRWVVQELTEDGMSTRAIAGALGVSKDTVSRDQRASGVSNDTPATVQGQDGKTYTRRQRKEVVELAPAPEPATDDLSASGAPMRVYEEFERSEDQQPLSFDAHCQGQIAWVNQLQAEQPDDLDASAGVALMQAILEVQKQFRCWTMGVKYTPPQPPPSATPRPPEPAEVAIPASLDTPEFRELWDDWKGHRIEKGGKSKQKLTSRSQKQSMNRMEKMGLPRALKALEYSISQGWDGVYEESAPEERHAPYGRPHRAETPQEKTARIKAQRAAGRAQP